MNWFKYRLPNTDPETERTKARVISGASNRLIHGLEEGFAIAPFLFPKKDILTIPFDFIPDPVDLTPVPSPLPLSTPKEDYLREVNTIIGDLNGQRGKTVAARVITIDFHIDINATFDALCEKFPTAFVFAFSTPQTGTWIGASPELLLRAETGSVFSIALAGTRPASLSTEDPEWDPKNIDEQMMVQEFISHCFDRFCKDTRRGVTYTKKAGPVEHICTPISAKLHDSSLSAISSILSSLSPTPAVCGNDRIRSGNIIEWYEKFHREMYGGFCGPCRLDGKTEFFVILRSAKCNEKKVSVYVGGGITSLSIPDEEWNETELKSKTIIHNLKTSE